MKLSNENETFILKSCRANSISNIELIQNLWSNYGRLMRITLSGSDYKSVIVKEIDLSEKSSHPRNWNTTTSHKRKLRSYRIESNWYKESQNFQSEESYFPSFIDLKSSDSQILLIIEDLNNRSFSKRLSSCDNNEIKLCLKWLAHFHSIGLNTSGKGLWGIGTYWHLNTRLDELKEMPESDLKNHAHQIDNRLNDIKYSTILHGDAKLANFCFNDESTSVAAVDFQYVGKGCGIKDFIYFLSSTLNEIELENKSETYLEYYFDLLGTYTSNVLSIHQFKELKSEWTKLYPFAIADFERFLLGWNPGHYKLNSYTKKITDELLRCL